MQLFSADATKFFLSFGGVRVIFEYWGGTVEELFAYIFRIYKKFGGNNPSILAPLDLVSVAT